MSDREVLAELVDANEMYHEVMMLHDGIPNEQTLTAHERFKAAKAAARALLAQPAQDSRPCTCHTDDNPPVPCPRKYALAECRKAAQDARLTVERAAEEMRERAARECDEYVNTFKKPDSGVWNCAQAHTVASLCAKRIRALPPSGPRLYSIEEVKALLAFYKGVEQCFEDTWQCERCGHTEPWWTDCNADYATREARAMIAALEGGQS